MRIILVAFLLIALSASSSFAAAVTAAATHAGTSTEAGQTIFPANAANQEGPAVGRLSTGVYMAWSTLVTSYVIKTQHSSGTKKFGTASDSTAINWKPATKGADLEMPAGPTNSQLINEGGWSVM